MNQKLLNRITAVLVLLISAFAYFSTVQPSVSFWDCGEFIASSYALQVPHPPGTPFFLLVGRLFAMIPFADNIAFRINAISVISSALTAMFLYLIIVRLIRTYLKKETETIFESLTIYLSAAIGALSLSFSDTFWFSAVESEVYAFSTFFIAFVIWLIAVWNEKADDPGSEKYIILIFYLIGLSTGVHLMSVLAIVPIMMIIYFRKVVTDDVTLKKTAIIFTVHALVVIAIAAIMWASQTSTQPPSPTEYKGIDSRFFIILLVISVAIMGAFYKKIFQRNSFYLPIIFGGIALVAIYPGLVKYFPKLVTVLGKNNPTIDIAVTVLIFALVGFGIYWATKNKKEILNLTFKCLFFAMIGITSYSQIIIRANQETPINMNSPKTMTELESYINREQYGDFPTFARRFSNEPHQTAIYTEYSSDLNFLWKYQMNHMFNRYLFWNYIGRESSYQDVGVDWSDLFGIPFFIGLFGLYFHFRKDWKTASAFAVMFIFLGYLTAFYQNQQEPQPRERDYFYVGAFFVFSCWIGIGMHGIVELIREQFSAKSFFKPLTFAALLLGFIAVPGLMIKANWHEHNRSNNFVPWDYAYNMLQSVAPNAIIFTNGDNDTFPLWYLQDVEGVRRDVRIANLSLINTSWYVKQLKNTTPYGSEKIKLSFDDNEIDSLSLMRWESQEVSIPVSPEIIKQYDIKDSSIVASGKLKWTMNATLQFGDIGAVRGQDLIVLDILNKAEWKRPVYFAVTVSDDSKIGLDEYLQMEGMAWRVVPKKAASKNVEYINEPILRKQLFDEPSGFSKEYQPGFKYRGLNDKSIFFDENHERLVQNYRNAYIRLALHYLYQEKSNAKTIEALDKMDSVVPRDNIGMDYRIKHDVAKIYYSAGALKQYNALAKEVIEAAKTKLIENPRDINSWYNPYDLLLTHYENLGMYKDALSVVDQLQTMLPNDPNVNLLAGKFRRLAGLEKSETSPQKIEIK